MVGGQYIKLDISSPFPVIQRIEQLRAAVSHKEEIRFMEQDGGFTTVAYMVSGPETFDEPYSRECRGIVFGSDGAIAARPLHKFFNVNEKAHTQANELDWAQVARIMDKRDGSMIHTVRVPSASHGFDIKSKKSFSSDVANSARKLLLAREAYIDFCMHVVGMDMTAIFEYTSPRARIVIGYVDEELKLLHVRDNVTGRYLSKDTMLKWASKYGVAVVDDVPLIEPVEHQVRMYLKAATEETVTGLEGWVIQFKNGDMVKLKTKWYMDRHHAMTFLRRRDIAHMVIDESIDDLKSKLVGDGIDVSAIEAIERAVVAELCSLEVQVDELFATTAGKDRKTVALANRGHPLFNLLMQKYSGREPNVKAYYEKHLLDELFDLEQLNLVDSVAEAE